MRESPPPLPRMSMMRSVDPRRRISSKAWSNTRSVFFFSGEVHFLVVLAESR
jgi:hypothetical protein